MRRINGVLLLYHHVLAPDAATVMQHVNAIPRHSRFRIWTLNTAIGFPTGLGALQFDAIVLHYSLFGSRPFQLSSKFADYLDSCRCFKVAMFQDEYTACPERFALINRHGIDCIFTLIEPAHWQDTYLKYTSVHHLEYCIPGYVSDDLVAAASKYSRPDGRRCIDVGYRGRRLPYYMGYGAQEKIEIADGFKERACGLGLSIDIETDKGRRLYGKGWYRFLGRCRGMIGVEAGVSIFDLEGAVYDGFRALTAKHPGISFAELTDRLLKPWENNLPYRTISPRHFEAAAFRICQILFEGSYSGVLLPMVHYLPLKKDFSNFEEVIRLFRDPSVRRELTDNAYNDLVASGDYSYHSFVKRVDRILLDAGLSPGVRSVDALAMQLVLTTYYLRLPFVWMIHQAAREFPGRPIVRQLFLRIICAARRLLVLPIDKSTSARG